MIYGYVVFARGEWPIDRIDLEPDGRILLGWVLGEDDAWPRGEWSFSILNRERNLVAERVYADAGEKIAGLGAWHFTYALQVQP